MNGSSYVCLMCSLIIDNDIRVILLHTSMSGLKLMKMLFLCFPELDLQIHQTAVLCKACLDTVDYIYQFISQHQGIGEYFINNALEFVNVIKIESVKKQKREINDANNSVTVNNFTSTFKDNFYSEVCKICSNTASMDFAKLNVAQAIIHQMLYLLCPQLDLRSSSYTFLCDCCFEIVTSNNQVIFKHFKIIEQINTRQLQASKISILTLNEKKQKKIGLCDGEPENCRLNWKHLKSSSLSIGITCALKHQCNRNEKLNHNLIHIENKHEVNNGKHTNATQISLTPENAFNCFYCDYFTKNIRNFKRHMFNHTGEKPFKCSQCNYSTKYKTNLKQHLYTHTNEKPHKCTKCTYSTIYQTSIKQHMFVHTGKTPFQCTICDYTPLNKGNLKQHMLIHTEEKPFKCTYCDYSTKYKTILKQHMFTHTGEKPFKCSQCDYSPLNLGNLKRHLLTHTGQRPFKCIDCDYSAVSKRNLQEHIFNHTGEKPFKCTQCNYCTKYKARLKQHMFVHNGEKPLKCTICNYSVINKRDFKQHMLLHNNENPFKCTICDYSPLNKGNLKRHMLTHSKERPFKCFHCNYSSKYKAILKQHVLSDTGEKPFKCVNCSYSTISTRNLPI